ncbi:4-coumarate--CoA ligase 1 [Ixodes scapularis]|uniref:4-coumarate--CoA ligase 1 n=1 Tax=Ixodes scapularis TaxID=6945 RepID=UPI001A9E0BA2|nr:4-coumarate--CoA ligase 1 [Ixodes scapularis]
MAPTRIVDGVVHSPFPDFDVGNYSAPRLIRERLSTFGDTIVAVDDEQQLTGKQLLKKIQRHAMGFQRSGLGPGSYVCAHLSNTVENVAAVLGVVFVGGTVVLARPTLVTRELLYEIKDSGCRFALADKSGASKLLEVEKEYRFEEMFCIGDLPGFTDINQFQQLSESCFKEYCPSKNTDDVIAVIYTSGSTGLPKGVEASHMAFVSSFHSFCSFMPTVEGDVFLTLNPLTHGSGFLINVFYMCTGVTTVFREPCLSTEDFLKDLETYEVSTLLIFTTKMQAIIDEAKAKGKRVPRMKHIYLVGGTLHKSLTRDLCELFGNETSASAYALTEALGYVSAAPLGQGTDNVGFPVAGCKVKVVDPASGKTMASCERGEICVQCSSMMKGYHRRPEATAAVLTGDGWLRTGDFGYLDDEGRLYIVDRLKQMIKCMDNQVAPAELEEILLSHDAVKEVAVVGLPSAKYGEAPAACVVLRDVCKEKHEVVAKELKQLVAGRTAIYKHLYGGVIFMESLPRSDAGKILRQELKRKVAARQAT